MNGAIHVVVVGKQDTPVISAGMQRSNANGVERVAIHSPHAITIVIADISRDGDGGQVIELKTKNIQGMKKGSIMT